MDGESKVDSLTTWLTYQMKRSDYNSSAVLDMLNKLLTNKSGLHQTLHSLMAENETFWWRDVQTRRVGPIAFYTLISLYTVLILAGALGNSLVIWAVIRQPSMRTLRNTFVINLAVSDLLLCLLTMPLTLIEIVSKYWPLGDSVFSCKMAGGLQAVSIFVSTMSITTISLDRYQLIIYPTLDYLKKMGAAAGLLTIWTVSFLLASPIFIFRSLDHHLLTGLPQESVDYCYENWPIPHGRALYSLGTIIVQYAAPILIVSIVHAKICRRLRLRHTMMVAMCKDSRKKTVDKKRLRRLNTLLVFIAFIFAICWMPLNVFNLILDIYNPFPPEETETMLIIYAVCHMLSMSSACANPFLYGWLNENFRNEFREICFCKRPVVTTSPSPAGAMAATNDSDQPASPLKDLTSRLSNHVPANSEHDNNVNLTYVNLTSEVILDSSTSFALKRSSTVV